MGDGCFIHNSKDYETNGFTLRTIIELVKRSFNALTFDEFCTSAICSNCHHTNNTFVRSKERASKESQRQFHFFLKDKLTQNGYHAWKEDATKYPLIDKYKKELVSHGSLLEKHIDKKKYERIYKRVKEPHGCLVCSNCHTPWDRDKNATSSLQILGSCWLKGLYWPNAYSRDKYKPFIENDEVEAVRNNPMPTLK